AHGTDQPAFAASDVGSRSRGGAIVVLLSRLRDVASPQTIAALLGFLVVAPLAASDGGYWPTAWGWPALAFCWLAVLALFLRDGVRIEPAERVLLLGFAAFLAWIVTSISWTWSVGRTVLEAERALMYLAALLAAVLLVRARSYRALLAGVWAAISLVASYALATRLFPERLGVFDAIAGYRLSEPLGYWNALGILAGMGTLLALGHASRSPGTLTRSLAGASIVVLLPTLYFTFSRASWIAIAVGLASAIALDPRRLQLVTTGLALAPAPAIALTLAYRSDALNRPAASLAAASREGHRLALILALLAAANGLAALALAFAGRRVSVSPRVRRGYAVVLALLVLAALASVFVRYGSPPRLAQRGYDALAAREPEAKGNLNRRLFTLSSRGRVTAWQAAWADFEDHRWLGSGAGTYELYWARHRPSPTKVRDAHSLYLETLAELGPVGLLVLVAALLTPVVAAVAARRHRLVPAALAAYVAYLVHAGVDWDWEMTAVTVTALLCGAASLAAARRGGGDPLSRRVRFALVAAALVLAAGALVGAVGNGALAAARRAGDAGEWRRAESHARDAIRWMPWSSDPWQALAEAELARGDSEAARTTLRTAIAKDPDDWELWLDLALASKSRARREAAVRALRLNPLGRELAGLRRLLGVEEAGGATAAEGAPP
ncbi:MAG: O-antigen ligase family protein, partial [Actinomycetota bacterium]|nr:O-antigen ligase family protein [Actinomycetota bacterium]